MYEAESKYFSATKLYELEIIEAIDITIRHLIESMENLIKL